MFVIEDDMHSEGAGEFAALTAAWDELRRIADIPFGKDINRPPCTSYHTCHRAWIIIQYDDSEKPWRKLRTIDALEVSSAGARWKTAPGH